MIADTYQRKLKYGTAVAPRQRHASVKSLPCDTREWVVPRFSLSLTHWLPLPYERLLGLFWQQDATATDNTAFVKKTR